MINSQYLVFIAFLHGQVTIEVNTLQLYLGYVKSNTVEMIITIS